METGTYRKRSPGVLGPGKRAFPEARYFPGADRGPSPPADIGREAIFPGCIRPIDERKRNRLKLGLESG
jgi:hypothetical protein